MSTKWEALEADIRAAYDEMPNERKLDVWLADSMDLVDAYALQVHADACDRWTLGGTPKRRQDCGHGWYCDRAPRRPGEPGGKE